MKYSFVKDFPGIGACDAYIGAVVSGKKEEKKGCIVCELLAAVDEKCFSGKEGQLFSANLFHEEKLVTCVLAGLGEKATPKSVEAAFAGAVKEAKKQKPGTVGILVHPDFADKCVEAVLLADDGFDAHKSEKADEVSYVFYGVEESQTKEGIVLGEAVRNTRRLVNEPSNVMTPAQLATEALLAGADSGFDVKIYDLAEIKKLGMKAFLEVARGSDREPKVIAMSYYGNPESPEVLGLVGKGLCYDSGGYSLKPSTGMETMHTDMGGAGAVIGAISAIAKMRRKVNVTAVVAACENILSAHAYHPGDIIDSMAGKTIEINNTDAEGRVTLADAVTFAIREQKATHIIDVATLTGAAITALGNEITAVVSDSDALWEKVQRAAGPSCEKVWRLPVDDVLGKALDSKIADMRNSSGRAAGTICGGMFIQKFAEGLQWVQLDIAGSGYTDGNTTCSFGATGVGVRLLYHTAKNCEK